MENSESLVIPKSTFWQKLRRFLLYTLVAIVVGGFIINLLWRYSGDGQWVEEPEVNGVKIFGKKEPGRDMMQYKAIMHTKSSLAGLVALMKDASVCADFGCYDSKMFEHVSEQEQYYTYKFKLPKIFKPRDFVVKFIAEQNPNTKEVVMVLSAVPDRLPADDCCLRITDMNNIWKVRPLGNGEVEIEYIINMDEGGMIPDLVLNKARAKFLGRVMPMMLKVLARDKYQNAKFDFINE